MEEIMITLGTIPYLIVAIVGFILGLLSNFIVDGYHDAVEKAKLIDLFVTDIHRNWQHIEGLKAAPTGPYLARIRPELKGISGLTFHGEPEFKFEVHNMKLYEIEGLKLSALLSTKTRIQFWEAISLLRDAEAVRNVIIRLPSEDKDLFSYKKLFVELVSKLSSKLSDLSIALREERPWFIGGKAI